MRTTASRLAAALLASVRAGPIFLLSIACVEAFSVLPNPVPFDPSEIILFVFALVPSCIVGFVLSFLPNLFGTYLLSAAGETCEAAREPIVWIGIGGLAGFGIALVFGAIASSLGIALALISTSAACAGICRRGMKWED